MESNVKKNFRNAHSVRVGFVRVHWCVGGASFLFACSALISHSARPARRHHLILRRDFTAERFLCANFFRFFFPLFLSHPSGLAGSSLARVSPRNERGTRVAIAAAAAHRERAEPHKYIYMDVKRERAGARLYLCTRGLRLFSQSAPRPTDQPKDQLTNTRQLGVDYRKPTFGSCTLCLKLWQTANKPKLGQRDLQTGS